MTKKKAGQKILGFIPARGGSKGIPKKNLVDVYGKPLLVWSIESALSSKRLTDVLVSTDDQMIADVATQHGASVPFLRPSDLASDTAPTEAAMLHAVEFEAGQGRTYDAVVLLQPTSPLRLANTIDNAIKACLDFGYDSLVGVCEDHGFTWQNLGNPIATYDPMTRPRRQDVCSKDKRYRETGSIYVTKTSVLMKTGSRLAGNIKIFEMAEIEGREIDTPIDLMILTAMMNYHQRNLKFERP